MSAVEEALALRGEAERLIAEDRVPTEELERLVAAYGPAAPEEPGAFAVIVVLSARGGECAAEYVRERLSRPPEPEGTETLYVSGPWAGIPAGARVLATEGLRLRASYPNCEERVQGILTLSAAE